LVDCNARDVRIFAMSEYMTPRGTEEQWSMADLQLRFNKLRKMEKISGLMEISHAEAMDIIEQ